MSGANSCGIHRRHRDERLRLLFCCSVRGKPLGIRSGEQGEEKESVSIESSLLCLPALLSLFNGIVRALKIMMWFSNLFYKVLY